jgi:hypothetical protein
MGQECGNDMGHKARTHSLRLWEQSQLPRRRQEDNIKGNPKTVGCEGWTRMVVAVDLRQW